MLALLFVAVPILLAAAVLWMVASFTGQSLTGWRRSARRAAGLLALLGLLLGGYLFSQTIGKEFMRSHDAQRAEAESAAEAQAKRDAEKKDNEARAQAFWQCHASKAFVGHWLVRRPGADYIMGLYADGSFSIRDVFHNDGALRLVPAGRWYIDEKIVHGLRESAEFVWLVPGKRGAEQRIAQRVLEHKGDAFTLQDARGDTVQYSKDAGSPEPPLCS